MAVSLRLLILRTFDWLTRCQCGITWFLGSSGGAADSGAADSGYQRLVDIALTKQVGVVSLSLAATDMSVLCLMSRHVSVWVYFQNARVMVAVSALIKKMHIYEALVSLQNSTNR